MLHIYSHLCLKTLGFLGFLKGAEVYVQVKQKTKVQCRHNGRYESTWREDVMKDGINGRKTKHFSIYKMVSAA